MERFNFNATTHGEADNYLLNRARQLLPYNIFIRELHHVDAGTIALFDGPGIRYQAVYILEQCRHRGHFERLIKLHDRPVITMDLCKIERWLLEKGIPHVCLTHSPWCEYSAIEQLYGSRTSRRSNVYYMNHIDEGLAVLSWIHASSTAKRAYCLHPVFQTEDMLIKSMDRKAQFWHHCDRDAIVAAMEYRAVANDYLSFKVISSIHDIKLSPIKDVNDMLIADKVQNRKDFELYHEKTHPRSKELVAYFRNWTERLGVSEDMYQRYKRLLTAPDRVEKNF